MSEKKERIFLLGASGAGKDYLLKKLVDKGLKPCIKLTTRPKRKHEQQGITYNFISESKFIEYINDDKLLVYQKFTATPENSNKETWYYGITKEEFNTSQVFIITPCEFNNLNLTKDERKKCFVVYLDIDRKTRELRLNLRKDNNDSIKRRLDADDIDFNGFKDYDLKIKDPDFSPEDVYDLMD